MRSSGVGKISLTVIKRCPLIESTHEGLCVERGALQLSDWSAGRWTGLSVHNTHTHRRHTHTHTHTHTQLLVLGLNLASLVVFKQHPFPSDVEKNSNLQLNVK